MPPTLRNSPSGPLIDFASSTSEVDNDSVVPGASSSDALDVLDTRLTEFTRGNIVEYFAGGADHTSAPQTLLGDSAWSVFGTSTTLVQVFHFVGISNRYGMYNLSAVATTQIGALMLGSSAEVNPGFGFLPSQIESVEWTCAVNVSSGLNGKYRFGFGSHAALSNFGPDGIFLEVDREISTFWRAIARRGGSQAVVTSAVVGTNNVFFKVRVDRQTNGSFSYFVNDVLIANILAINMPTGRIFVGAQIESTINSGQDLLVDTCRLRYSRS